MSQTIIILVLFNIKVYEMLYIKKMNIKISLGKMFYPIWRCFRHYLIYTPAMYAIYIYHCFCPREIRNLCKYSRQVVDWEYLLDIGSQFRMHQVNVEGGQPVNQSGEPMLGLNILVVGPAYTNIFIRNLWNIFLILEKYCKQERFSCVNYFYCGHGDDEWLRSSNSWPWIFNILSDDAENIYRVIWAQAGLECLAGDVIDKRTFLMLSDW